MWADSDEGYADTRIIFVDTETSNWTFDEARGQYFWHRFFSHQPDLNYDEPAVVEAVLDVLRFWADKGVDGFRLDAIPYLIEREGTNCENLPGTHDVVARIREALDREYPGVITIAEANQMPEEVVEYFGTPERPECTMCLHFPVMPRIYRSLREGTPASIRDVLTRTPRIPAHGQWGTFLRNHDELTLEMVDDEERALMYGWYAPGDRMRANVGIRRRLAPLLGTGGFEILDSDRRVLVHLRSDTDSTVLCLANLSTDEVEVALPLPGYEDGAATPLVGNGPAVALDSTGAAPIRLGPRGYEWYALVPGTAHRAKETAS